MRHVVLICFFYLCSVPASGWSLVLIAPARAAEPSKSQNRNLDLSALSERSAEELLDALPALRSGNFHLSDLDRALEFLAERGEYDRLEFEQWDNTTFKLNLGRVRRVQSISFKNAPSFSDSVLRIETGIQEKSKFDQGGIRRGAERLRAFYESQGFRSAEINVEVPEGPAQEVDIEMVVSEGPRSLMAEFQVSAANSRFRAKAIRFLESRKGLPYTQKNVADLQRDFRKFLSENKYYASALAEPVVTLSEDGASASLFYHFDRTDEFNILIEGALKVLQFKVMTALDLENYSSANPNLAAELSTRVRSYYLSQGYARVEVSAQEKPTIQDFTKTVVITINEGPRIAIKNIEIQGSISQPESFYRDFILNHSSEVLKEKFYVREDVETGLTNLINDRLNNGYLKARIVSTRFIYTKEKNAINIIVQMDEGPLTQMSKLRFSGNQSFSEAELSQVLELQEGGPLRLNKLEEAIVGLRKHYLDQGFLEFQLLNKDEDLVVYNDDNSMVEVHFKIKEGPRIIVGNIFIDGNVITQDRVILKELEFKVGDTLTPALVEESISRLQRLGHFSQIEIKTLEEKTNISRRTVIVKVTDRDPGLLNIGAGFNNELGLTVRGYLGLGYRNIGGSGRAISSRIDANYNVTDVKFFERKITVGYLEPYLFDSRTKGRVNITRQTKVSDLRTTQLPGGEFRRANDRNEGTTSLEQDITSHWTVYWDVWSIGTKRDFYFGNDGQEDKDRSVGLTNVTIGSTALTSEWDFRNHPFLPTSGSFWRANIEYGSPSLGSTGTIEYFRSTAYHSHYLPVIQKWQWIWANSIRLGHLQNLSTKDDGAVPFDEKGFVYGGFSTVRGFTPDETYLNRDDFKRSDFGTDTEKYYALRGQAHSYLIKTELRIPIIEGFGSAVFFDYGGVKVSDSIRIPEQNRLSAGIAGRIITPVGPLTVEYAWKLGLDPRRNESPGSLHISFGTF